MKKFSFFLLILVLTRVGTTYAAPNDGTTLDFQNFFLGNSANPNVNVNQVLALLVGPEGQPGPAGVAGRDGFVGMNGQDGKDGLPGAPGPVGPQGADGPAGASVVAVVLNVGDPDCANGGSKFISGDGSTAFACNGAAGATGAPGATGAQGPQGLQGLQGEPGEGVVVDTSAPGLALVAANCESGGKAFRDGEGNLTYLCNGTGGTGGGGFSAGINGLVGCSEIVEFSVIHHFDNSVKEFLLDGFKLKGLNIACLNIGNFASLNFSIQDSGVENYSQPRYLSGDSISCSNEITSTIRNAALAAKNDSDELDFIFGDVSNPGAGELELNPTCTIERTGETILLSQISSRDLGDTVAFQFTPIP